MNADVDNFPAPASDAEPNAAGGARWKFVFVLVFLHLAIALPLAYWLNIWVDEASTLYTTRGGFVTAFQGVFADEKQAPLYFLALSLWRMLGDSIFFARLFSVLCSILAIKFFDDAARRLFGEADARFVSVLFALHPFLVWSSAEIRVYSLVVLLSVLLLKLFFEAYAGAEFSRARTEIKLFTKPRIYFILTAIVGVYANYYLGFLLVGCFAALLATRRFAAARAYFLQMLVVAVALLPLAVVVAGQFATNTSGFVEDKSVTEAARILWSHFLSIVLPTELFPAPETSAVSFFRLWLARAAIVGLIILLARNKFRALDRQTLATGAMAASVSACLAAAYFLLGIQYVALRHAAVLFAPLALFAFALLRNVLPKRRPVWIFFAVLFAFLYPYSIYKNYPNGAKRGDWARIARFVEQNEKPYQSIVVFPNYDALALPFHYKGANEIVPDEKFFAWNQNSVGLNEGALEPEINFVTSKIPSDAPEIWLATGEICQNPKTAEACRALENFINEHYTVVDSRDFYLERLRLLRKK